MKVYRGVNKYKNKKKEMVIRENKKNHYIKLLNKDKEELNKIKSELKQIKKMNRISDNNKIKKYNNEIYRLERIIIFYNTKLTRFN